MTNYSNNDRSLIDSDEWIVCTLFEGDYHFGLAALTNSLAANGFQGCIVVGYRGPLPPWLNQLKKSDREGEYDVCRGVRLKFILLDIAIHFTNFKPQFMRRLIHDQVGCKYIWYFDPDIVVRCAWSFYVQWVKYGIALCEDVTNGTMPINHPIRCRWKELVSEMGLQNPAPLARYYNGGFVGLPTKYESFLTLWADVIKFAESHGVDTRAFGAGSRINPFYGSDQDAMNVAAMYCGHPLTTIGPEGMDLVPGGFTMSHAIGSPKPWRKNMILSALRGVPPSGADKAFLVNLQSPIKPYSQFKFARMRFGKLIGAFIGRFYRRH